MKSINNSSINNSAPKSIMMRRPDAYSPPSANPLSSSLLSTLHHMSLFNSPTKSDTNYDEFEDELLMLNSATPTTPTPKTPNGRRNNKRNNNTNTHTHKNPPLPQPMHPMHQKATQPMCVPSRRNRTMSQGSTGSNAFSPVSSFSSSYLSSSSPSPHSLGNSLAQTVQKQTGKKEEPLLNDIVKDPDHAASGNMFHKRTEWTHAVFNRLKPAKRNAFHVRTEDEGPYGNDETRCFVLAHFSAMRVKQLRCVLCDDEMKVYDRFPLVDGTMYVSPVNYSKNAVKSPRGEFIYGVCLSCLNGDHEVRCRVCARPWCADALQIGTLYKYDVLAAWQCCEARSKCAKCGRCVARRDNRDMFFSTYSDECECGWCRAKAHHYVKSPSQLLTVNRLI